MHPREPVQFQAADHRKPVRIRKATGNVGILDEPSFRRLHAVHVAHRCAKRDSECLVLPRADVDELTACPQQACQMLPQGGVVPRQCRCCKVDARSLGQGAQDGLQKVHACGVFPEQDHHAPVPDVHARVHPPHNVLDGLGPRPRALPHCLQHHCLTHASYLLGPSSIHVLAAGHFDKGLHSGYNSWHGQLMNKLLIKNGTLLTMEGDRQPRRADLLVEGGTIKRIDTAIDRSERPDTIIDASGMIVLPGLIFAHSRLAFSLLRGQTDQILDDAERERLALKLIAGFSPDQVRCSAALGICQAVRSGITTLFDGGAVASADQIFAAARSMGFRLIGGRMLADATPEWPETLRMPLREQLAEAQSLIRAVAADDAGGLLRPAVTTTNALLCSNECLSQARAMAEAAGLPLKIILTTDRNQLESIRSEGGPQELATLDTLGILGERTFLVNPSFVSELERNLIRKAGARVVVNVSSDLKLGRPLPRVPEFLRKGTPVLAGFDSPVYGGRMDAMRELFIMATAFRPTSGPQAMTPEQVLSMVTVDAARSLGIDDIVGTLEPGKRADIVVVDPGHDVFAQPSAHTSATCRLVYESSVCSIACTMIDGNVVYRDGTVTVCDEQALVEQANAELVHVLENM